MTEYLNGIVQIHIFIENLIDLTLNHNLSIVKAARSKSKDADLKRVNKQSLAFNNREMRAINGYIKKYKVNNKSKFMREAIIKEVLKKFDSDYPTLFDLNSPSLFVKPKSKEQNTIAVSA